MLQFLLDWNCAANNCQHKNRRIEPLLTAVFICVFLGPFFFHNNTIANVASNVVVATIFLFEEQQPHPFSSVDPAQDKTRTK